MTTHTVFRRVLLALTLLTLTASPSAMANVHVDFGIWHGYNFYYSKPALVVSNVPTVTYHRLESPSGRVWINRGDNNNADSPAYLTNLTEVISESTTGLWKLFLNKGDASEQVYYFSIAVTGVTSNFLGNVTISSPVSGSTGVTNRPPIHWTGPNNLPTIDVSMSYFPVGNNYFATFPSTVNEWNLPGPLTPGENTLFVNYRSNNFPGITFSTPTNALGESLPDWSAQGEVHTYLLSIFDVGSDEPVSGNLFAHFTFDDSGYLTHDDSGGGHDGNEFYPGSGNQFPEYNPDGISGGAIEFDGFNGLFWDEAMTNAFTGSYSVSLWVKTAQAYGSDEDSAYNGANIFDSSGNPIPMALTGNKLAFETDHGFYVLHSSSDINTDEFTHLVITRNADSGEKRIYINGELDAFEFDDGGTTSPAYEVNLGFSFTSGQGIEGLVDDLQIYSGPLSPEQIAFLYENPGETAPAESSLGEALDALELNWTTGGDAPWTVQTDTTYDGTDAAQSGVIDDDQESWIETTVEGPGELSFWWKTSSEDGADYLAFTIDDEYQTDISGDWDWDQQTYEIEPGTHTLRWRYSKNGCCVDYDDAAYLDQVIYIPEIATVPVTFSLTVYREVRDAFESFAPGQVTFFAFPHLDGIDDPVSYHQVESPDGFCQTRFGADSGASSGILTSFDTLLSRLTNGVWKLWLNKETPQEKLYTFTVSVAGLSSNALENVIISAPLDGSALVPPNTPYQWTGPSDWDDLRVRAIQLRSGTNFYYANSAISPAAQTWNDGPVLASGTNSFTVDYSKPVTNFIVNIPYPEFSVGQMTIHSVANSGFIVANPAITLLAPKINGANLEFSFQSQNGMTHLLLSRTNLTTGTWQTNSVISGDGDLKLISIPKTNSQQYFRLNTY